MHSEKLPMGRALLWIFLWTLAISGSAWMGWFYYLHLKQSKMQNPQYRIIAIVQSTPQSEHLKTVYFAELLNLSLDKPTNLYQFNTREAERLLLSSPLIKQATVKRIHPGTLYIDYQMRTPVAYLGDYTNTAIDQEGVIFPFSPFFTPKKIPTVYIGLDTLDKKWGVSLIEDPRMKLALDVIQHAQGEFTLKKVDVSQAFSDSYGQRQIVIGIEEQLEAASPYFLLRLHPEYYQQNLANYLVFRQYMIQNWTAESFSLSKPSVIDFRIPHLAFIKKES